MLYNLIKKSFLHSTQRKPIVGTQRGNDNNNSFPRLGTELIMIVLTVKRRALPLSHKDTASRIFLLIILKLLSEYI